MVTTATELEQRVWQGLQLRAGEGKKPRLLRGQFAVYNLPSVDMGYTEKVAPGAFASAFLPEADVRCFHEHDPARILGRTTAGTLRLFDERTGPAFECDIPDTSWGADVAEAVRRGDLSQCSFGFRIRKDRWEEDHETGTVTRILLEVELIEISVVSVPAYPQTSVQARANQPTGPVNNIHAARLRLRLLDLQARAVGIIDF